MGTSAKSGFDSSGVLIISCDGKARQDLAGALRAYGANCTEAASLDEALGLIPGPFEAAIVHASSGIESIRRLRASDGRMAIVAVTPKEVELARQALQLGADEHISEPFLAEQLNLALEKAIERKRLSEGMERELLQLVLHDLSNSLSVTIGYLSLMRSNIQQPHESSYARDVAAAMDSCEAALELIRQLEKLCSPGTPNLISELGPVDVVELVGSEVAKCAGLAERVKKKLEFLPPSCPFPKALADQAALRCIVKTLLWEGIRNSSGAKSVAVEVDVTSDGSEIRISVADDGLSVPAQLREAIFDMARQVELKRLRTRRGMGLVLPFARKSCEQMGARIWVDDAPLGNGRGCKFTLALPIWKAKT